MNKHLLTLLIGLTILLGCKKEEIEKVVDVHPLFGKWELKSAIIQHYQYEQAGGKETKVYEEGQVILELRNDYNFISTVYLINGPRYENIGVYTINGNKFTTNNQGYELDHIYTLTDNKNTLTTESTVTNGSSKEEITQVYKRKYN